MRQAVAALLPALCVVAGCVATKPLAYDPPSAGPVAAPVFTPTASPAPKAATPPPAAATMQVGRKKIDVSSVELDAHCARLVAPFTPTDNFNELGALAADGLGSIAGAALESKLSPNTKPKPDTRGQQHQLSLAMRQSAVRMNWLPMSLEVAYGEHQHKQLQHEVLARESTLGRKLYPVADKMLADLLHAVEEPHAYHFKVFIRTSADENAMALPGGLLYIDKALVAEPDKLGKGYFALAHEIAHVLQRHETRIVQARIVDSVSLRGGVADLARTLKQAKAGQTEILNTVLAGKLLFEQHYAGQELQSDACAVRVLDRGFQNPTRLRTAIQSFVNALPADNQLTPLKAKASGADAITNVVELVTRPVDRHPGTAERVRNLNAMLAGVAQRPATAPR